MSDHDQEVTAGEEESADREVDPVRLQMALERLQAEQSLGGAVAAGAIAAAVGAAIWAAVTVFTGYQIGWLAVGVGFLVGFAVRWAGKGIDRSFGFVGAFWALVGCAAGNLLAVCALIAQDRGISLGDVLSRLDVGTAAELMVATFSPIDLFFYGFAVYEGFRFSLRQLVESDLDPFAGGELES